jgi:PAS domain S-box-containing protein
MEKEQIYGAVMKNLPYGFSILDKDGFIIDFNSLAETITGYSRDEVLGKSHDKILHGSSDATECPLMKYAFREQRQVVAIESMIKKKNGKPITLSVTIAPLADEYGNFMGGVEFFRDISEQKRKERERRNILSMFAHDMKSPVIASAGFISRFLGGKTGSLTKEQRAHLEVVRGELEKLQHLTTDFLEFARFDAKVYKPEAALFDIHSTISHCLESARSKADEKHIGIAFERAEAQHMIEGDEAMINRVVTNLLDNAIKYTNPGGYIAIKLSSQGDNAILVQVSDTGVGIAESQIHLIFDAFYRVHGDANGSSGLGLYIVKSIVKAHGGKVWVESSLGKGSTVSFVLPEHLQRISPK